MTLHYAVVHASSEQASLLLAKHIKPFLGIPKIVSKSYFSDYQKSNGYVTLHTITGKKVSYQMRDGKPMFVEFTGFGDVRYEIPYPETENKEMFDLLSKYGEQAKKDFWAGGDI